MTIPLPIDSGIREVRFEEGECRLIVAGILVLRCLRCGHVWIPNKQGQGVEPDICGSQRCKSHWWDQPRKLKRRTA